MPWNPEQYNKFKDERLAPFFDLLALVNKKEKISAIDLGCGTGEITRLLFDALPQSQVTGIDSSQEMLNKSKNYEVPGLTFRKATIQEITNEGTAYDLVFSNAAIQWVEGHKRLIPDLLSIVKKGGQLVIQLPSNHSHYTHRAIMETACEEPYKSLLNGWVRISPVLSLEDYAGLLYDNGGKDIVAFEKAYPHVLADCNALVDWVSGTALVPYMERLPVIKQTDFKEAYRNKLLKEYPQKPVFYPFKRILFSAVKG